MPGKLMVEQERERGPGSFSDGCCPALADSERRGFYLLKSPRSRAGMLARTEPVVFRCVSCVRVGEVVKCSSPAEAGLQGQRASADLDDEPQLNLFYFQS